MEQTREGEIKKTEALRSEPYQEPLLIKHEPLLDITGVKYGEKKLAETPA